MARAAEGESIEVSAGWKQELEFADGTLQYCNLSHGVPGELQFRADLSLEVTGIADFVDEEFQEAFGRQQGVRFEFFDRLIIHRHVGAADVEDDIVMPISPQSLEP